MCFLDVAFRNEVVSMMIYLKKFCGGADCPSTTCSAE